MRPNRRHLLLGLSALALSTPARAQAIIPELDPRTTDDQSGPLQDALLRASAEGRPLFLPPGTYYAQNLQVLSGIAAGPQFDRSYMDAQIGAHQYALTNLDRMLQQGGLGDDITGVMRMMRTAVASHLQMAQQIRARLGS